MKKVVTLVIVLVLVLVAAPWGIGRIAEQRVNAGLDKLVEEAPYLTIVERKWTPGWFRSEQEVTFEVFGDLTRAFAEVAAEAEKQTAPAATDIDAVASAAAPLEAVAEPDATKTAQNSEAPEGAAEEAPEEAPEEEAKPPAEPVRFTVRNEILHGPVLWPASLGLARVNTKFVLSDDIRKGIVEFFGTDEPFRLSTRVGFFGGGTTSFAADARTIKVKDGTGQIAYDDLEIDVGYSKNLDSIDIDGGWAKVEASSPDGGQFVMRGLRVKGDSRRVRGELYDGDVKFVIDQMTIVDKDKVETGIADIHYIVTTSLEGDFMDVGAKVGSGKVTSPQLQALQLDLSEVHYDFTVRHLQADALDKMMVAFKKAYTQPMTDAAAVDTALTAPLKEHGLELLKNNPEFVIERMGIVTPDGEGVIKGVVRLDGVVPEDFAMGALGLLGKIDADITIELAQKLIEKIPNGATGAGMAVDQGYAKREGEKLVSRIEFKKGELQINGKAQALPGLGGPPQPEGEGPVAVEPEEPRE